MSRRQAGNRFLIGSIVLTLASAIVMAVVVAPRVPAGVGVGMMRPLSSPVQQGLKGALEGGRGWINTGGRPIHMADLRGKLVLLDFWTYCCINCHHVLPDLAKLEAKYKNELVVIGVHTAKFDAEKVTANILKKVREYQIKHPVVNDADQLIWRRFGVSSWPTLVLIDANGEIIGAAPGEGNYDVLDQVIGKLVKAHKDKGELDETPVNFYLETEKAPHTGPLESPGKVLADAAGKRLFIADTANNRIVVTDLDGKHLQTYGNGLAALTDGGPTTASFNRPQGMCLVADTLYVADTENHAIRAIDLKSEMVKVVAGDGKQGRRREGKGEALITSLNSPWDVLPKPGANDDALLIAMAGPHQLWKLDLKAGTVGVWAGTSSEDIQDGSLAQASFAQPSGLATDGKTLFVADSEGSCVRAVNAGSDLEVATLVGEHDLARGASLFSFGDIDGRALDVRLQHCLGLAYAEDKLYIADTYNNKIKVCDPKTQTVKTLAGAKQAGADDSPARFDEPGGLSVAGDILYIADTNNHQIRTLNLKTNQVHTLKLEGVKAPSPPRKAPTFPNAIVMNLPAVKVAPGNKVTLDVVLDLPAGLKVNPDAPMPYLLEAPKNPGILGPEASPTGSKVAPPKASFSVTVPIAKGAEDGQLIPLKLSVQAFLCKGGSEGYCKVQNYVWNVPLSFAKGGESRVALKNAEPKAKGK